MQKKQRKTAATRSSKRKNRGAVHHLKASNLTVAALDFDRPVIYRGVKILPIVGKRSAVSRAIRDDLRKQYEQERRK